MSNTTGYRDVGGAVIIPIRRPKFHRGDVVVWKRVGGCETVEVVGVVRRRSRCAPVLYTVATYTTHNGVRYKHTHTVYEEALH